MMYLGVENDDAVVVYGGKNCFRCGLIDQVVYLSSASEALMSVEHSAARCWWTLKFFGHENVHILNGRRRAENPLLHG